MINHHPRPELIKHHAAGELPVGLAIAVSVHCSMCSSCQQALIQAEAELASTLLDDDSITTVELDIGSELAFADICQQITELDEVETVSSKPHFICVKGNTYPLPTALQPLTDASWTSVGKISRMRYQLEDTAGRASLLHIDAGGGVPQHTHKGYELTLLLDGEFSDETGHFVKGDFIERDANHEHAPFSEQGCLCFTLVDAPLHFTKGLGKLLNPFGQLLY
ncbi:cupin domain-containing protein [Shewanella avicenniae]|uniref:Cupin domain-containing protein n=1 Tax=Shewanella avicenniae TaxID=2814294 RepID=A0ABX7QUA3_9GAMM|nr:ChrR family anti-sigma-E factor [Shewanella avicenniae]QSX35019.1 cupin domain-containing protein [Shewanella avicenniae]